MTMSAKQVDEMLCNVSYLQELLHITFSDASDAYEVLSNYEGDLKYSLSLNYLSMSNQCYLEMKRVYRFNRLEHYEIEPFFRDYEEFKLQLKQVITEKDGNTSWLSSSYDTLTKSKKSVNEFLSNWIKTSIK